MGYIANFIVYTLAMVGVLLVALVVFKHINGGGISNRAKILKVIDTMSIGPRKTLYIVSAGDEKFLIAGDVDKTTLISKLNLQSVTKENAINTPTQNITDDSNKSFQDYMNTKQPISNISPYTDKPYVDTRNSFKSISHRQDNEYTAVLKNLAQKMNASTYGGDK